MINIDLFLNGRLNYTSSINQAFEEYLNKNLQNSYSLFDESLETLAHDSNLLQEKNMIYINLEKYELMLFYLDKILNINSNDVEILIRMGRCNQMLGKLEKAMECFEKVLSIQPSNSFVLRHLVLIFINLEKYEKALSNLDQILSENPVDFEMIYFKAIILEIQGKSTESVNCYLKSIQISSSDVSELQSISLHMARLLGKEIAIPIFKHLLEHNSDNVLALDGMKTFSNPVYEY